jgi:hypothetical protein
MVEAVNIEKIIVLGLLKKRVDLRLRWKVKISEIWGKRDAEQGSI